MIGAESDRPVFYSFRRCPYAMRARMAVAASGQPVELREILLRDKPEAMVEASPKATVPVLVQTDGGVLEQSLDIMLWALNRSDPQQWLTPDHGDLPAMLALIADVDGEFKTRLDNYKYASRKTPDGQDVDAFASTNRDLALQCLDPLAVRLESSAYLFGDRIALADVAIAPFVRQFANTDATWFRRQARPALRNWLQQFIASPLFTGVMDKHAVWQPGTEGIRFPNQ